MSSDHPPNPPQTPPPRSKGKPDNTATAEDGALITDSGQLRKGTTLPDLTKGLARDPPASR